jgi:hypothetical protein
MTDHLWFEQELPGRHSAEGGCHGREAKELQAVAHFAKDETVEKVERWIRSSINGHV